MVLRSAFEVNKDEVLCYTVFRDGPSIQCMIQSPTASLADVTSTMTNASTEL